MFMWHVRLRLKTRRARSASAAHRRSAPGAFYAYHTDTCVRWYVAAVAAQKNGRWVTLCISCARRRQGGSHADINGGVANHFHILHLA